jgi:hypothetical protein
MVTTETSVQGRFVKFTEECGKLKAKLYQGDLCADEVIAISYSWGVLAHEKVLEFDLIDPSTREETPGCMALGNEWDIAALSGLFVRLSKTKYLWLDQLCLVKDEGLSAHLATEIATIYASCEVGICIATWRCEAFDELQRAQAPYNSEHFTKIQSHVQKCSCAWAWTSYFSRVWPFQEFLLASQLSIHLGLGDREKVPLADRRLNGLLHRARNQVQAKICDSRMWGDDETASMEPVSGEGTDCDMFITHLFGVTLIMGWGMECERRHKISTHKTYEFLTNYSKTDRSATKMIDLFFALVPLLELSFNISSDMSLASALKSLHMAFEAQTEGHVFCSAHKILGVDASDYDVEDGDVKSTFDLLPYVNVSNVVGPAAHLVECSVKSLGELGSDDHFLVGVAESVSFQQDMAVRDFLGHSQVQPNRDLSEVLSAVILRRWMLDDHDDDEGEDEGLIDVRGERAAMKAYHLASDALDLVLRERGIYGDTLRTKALHAASVALGVVPHSKVATLDKMVLVRVQLGTHRRSSVLAIQFVDGQMPDRVYVSQAAAFIGSVAEGRFLVCGKVLALMLDEVIGDYKFEGGRLERDPRAETLGGAIILALDSNLVLTWKVPDGNGH